MAITQLLGEKIRKYREQLAFSVEELAQHTGIPGELLKQYEQGEQEPSGDEILVLADFFKCDFRFFISNENVAPFERSIKPNPDYSSPIWLAGVLWIDFRR